jgi:histidinol-phosphate/aromatic aminotransferase/cobyric acid decarboxylase-like protein
VKVGRRFAAMPGWLRITIGKPEETEAFLAALRALVPARAAA